MKRTAYFLVIFVFVFEINAQNEDCICVSQTSLYEVELIDFIYPSKLISSTKTKSAQVYLVTNNSEQLEMVYRFNENGKLLILDKYFEGRPNYRRKYEYGTNGIIKEYFFYLDSIGNESDFQPKVMDYKYNSKGDLTLIQTREKGKVVPIEKTDYQQFEYDDLGRQLLYRRHFYWGEFHPDVRSVSETTIQYVNDTLEQHITTHSDGGEPLESLHHLNEHGKLVKVIYPGAREYYEYTDFQLISRFEILNESTFADECPEQANYVNLFKYNRRKLLTAVEHNYAEKTCKLVIKYE